MKKPLLTAILLALSSCAFAAQTTNCTTNEQIVFSCTAGKKIISVCSAPKGSANNYLEYRYSSSNKSKLTYRADQASTPRQFNRATLTGASSSSTVLWFENQGYLYAVSDPVKGTPSLIVQKAKKEISSTECKANMKIDLEISNALIRDLSSDAYFELFN
jgi:hypothetical protein